MYQEGEIEISQCGNCHATFPVFVFVADTDMVTIDCIALTASENRVLLTEQMPEESVSDVEERVGEGFKVVTVRYIEYPVDPGLSFQEFRKRHKAPEPIYSCPSCGGDSQVIEKKTKEEFVENGTIEVREAS